MARDWSEFEVEAVVTDYFAMLLNELRGEQYNKTAHRHALARLLAAGRERLARVSPLARC